MKAKIELFPKVVKRSNEKFQIYFWYEGKRYRYANGKPIGNAVAPNLSEGIERERKAHLLCSAFTLAIENGWRPKTKSSNRISEASPLLHMLLETVLQQKLKLNYSESYKKDLVRTKNMFIHYLRSQQLDNIRIDELSIDLLKKFVYEKSPSPASMKNLKRNISALLKDELESLGVILNFKRIKLPRTTQELHKPIKDVQKLLIDISEFNDNLYLCAMMTYGLLLRPHREIRCLTRGDFNQDFTVLSLDGSRVKSKKNRILPIPEFVRNELVERFDECEYNINLFSRSKKEYHADYFKNRWADYKKQSSLLEKGQTLYSLRHTSAIKVFEKTGSLLKLQQVMGHSDMKVSLTYLRGLEVKQLNVEDLPEL